LSYERLGLLPKPSRTPAGYRQYSDGVVNRLTLVRNAQRFGFSLLEIAAFLRVREAGGKPCHDVRAAAQRMLTAIDQQIDALVETRREMRMTIRAWDQRLASTPADRPARLLETLAAPRPRQDPHQDGDEVTRISVTGGWGSSDRLRGSVRAAANGEGK
jgi:DNA-binding transcriptional MerR regulator